MNSFLQILFHIPNFLNVLSENDTDYYKQDTLIYNIIYLSKYPYNSEHLYKIKKIMGEVNSKYGTFELVILKVLLLIFQLNLFQK